MLTSITSVLSPAAQQARAEEYSARSFQTTQVFSLNNRIRDLERCVEHLQDQLASSQCELAAAERRADRAEFMLECQTSTCPPSCVPS